MIRRDPTERGGTDSHQADISNSRSPSKTAHGSKNSWIATTRALLSSWSLRLGLLLLLPILIYVPWRQKFEWRIGESDVVSVRAVRHRFLWDPPWNSQLDVFRLLVELAALVALVMLAYLYERSMRHTRRSAKTEQVYSEQDWQEELRRHSEGRPPSACPACGRTGFYGPRDDPAGQHLRHCSFCGFQQRVGGEPTRLIPCVHDCDKVVWIAGAPQIAWVDPGQEVYECEFCGGRADVQACTVASPGDDPAHPWWDVPQNLSHEDYIRFWLRNGAPGRVYH
ncbi:MAG: hypothetical protein JSU87_07680 [Gemmatimonadota bacterium]|nr:MAG: hypothetical protein JSU87_07680 [Gemmatimonadota bacterium]